MEQEVLATVNINIGLGTDNPSLVIRHGDHVPTLVNRLIDNYHLPKKVYAIIMERVAQELPPPPPPPKELFLKTAKLEKEGAVSPLKPAKAFTPKHSQTRLVPAGKENNRNNGNNALNESKNFSKKSLSPLTKPPAVPTVKKIEIKPSKSPAKTAPNTAKPSKGGKGQGISHIQKLFRHLTKCNPPQVHILSHEHINLKGMDRELLSVLQEFFECLQEDEFEGMSEQRFLVRVQQLGFARRLGRREWG